MNTPLPVLMVTSIALTLTLSSSLSWAATNRDRPYSPASASSTVQPVAQLALRYVPPQPPSNGSRPGTRRGAASRGCLTLAQVSHDAVLDNLIALVPEIQTHDATSTQVWGYTSLEHPTLWFYNPYQSSSIQSIEFVLQTEQDQDLYRTPITVPPAVGILSVTLPTTITLQPGTAYHWYLKIHGKDAAECGKAETTPSDPLAPPRDPFAIVVTPLVYVDGWIERKSPDSTLLNALPSLSAQQQAALYAEKGFWYDAVNSLAAAKQSQTDSAAILADWRTLLQQIGLEKLAAQPLVPCCSINKQSAAHEER